MTTKKPKPLRKVVAAVPQRSRTKCSYCGKVFPSAAAAGAHERSRHARRQAALIEGFRDT